MSSALAPGIGRRIRQARETRGLTRTELGAAVGRSEQAVTLWEKGRNRPQLPALVRVADVLGVDLADLVNGDETEVVS